MKIAKVRKGKQNCKNKILEAAEEKIKITARQFNLNRKIYAFFFFWWEKGEKIITKYLLTLKFNTLIQQIFIISNFPDTMSLWSAGDHNFYSVGYLQSYICNTCRLLSMVTLIRYVLATSTVYKSLNRLMDTGGAGRKERVGWMEKVTWKCIHHHM